MKTDNTLMGPEVVARRLESLRIASGLSKGDFADSVEIDRSSYSKIIKAEKPLKIEMGFAVASRWGVTLDFIYFGRFDKLPEKYAKTIIAALT